MMHTIYGVTVWNQVMFHGPIDKTEGAGDKHRRIVQDKASPHALCYGRYVTSGQVPGVVTPISRRGEVHVDGIGMKTTGGCEPRRRETIFHIA